MNEDHERRLGAVESKVALEASLRAALDHDLSAIRWATSAIAWGASIRGLTAGDN